METSRHPEVSAPVDVPLFKGLDCFSVDSNVSVFTRVSSLKSLDLRTFDIL